MVQKTKKFYVGCGVIRQRPDDLVVRSLAALTLYDWIDHHGPVTWEGIVQHYPRHYRRDQQIVRRDQQIVRSTLANLQLLIGQGWICEVDQPTATLIVLRDR